MKLNVTQNRVFISRSSDCENGCDKHLDKGRRSLEQVRFLKPECWNLVYRTDLKSVGEQFPMRVQVSPPVLFEDFRGGSITL